MLTRSHDSSAPGVTGSSGDLRKYEDAKRQFPADTIEIVLRAKSIVVAGLLSLLAMVCLLVSISILVISNDLG
jgi:hypothetical protein